MNKRLIAYGATLFGLGALTGWAVVADYHEVKGKRERQALRNIINTQNDTIYELRARPIGTVRAIQQGVDGMSVYAEFQGPDASLDDRPKVDLKFDNVKSEIENGVRTIKNAEIIDVALVKDPLPGQGEILEVEKTDDDTEVRFLSEIEAVEKEETPYSEVSTEAALEHAEEVEESVVPDGETEEETRDILQQKIDLYTSSPEQRDEFIRQLESTIPVEPNAQPYIISQHTWAWGDENDPDDYEKTELKWFPIHQVLLNEDEDVIPEGDIPSLIGWKPLSNFGVESDDPRKVFVRNPKLKCDFEVILDDENEPPLHVRFGLPRAEFDNGVATGKIQLPGVTKFRREDV